MLSQTQIKEILYTSLLELGLKQQEIELYTLSLALGPTTIGSLSKELGMNRPNVYKVITELEKHGLAKFSERKKYSHTFMVESPSVVRDLLKVKKEALGTSEMKLFNSLPDLLALYRQGELPTSIKILEGHEQFMKVFYDVLDEAKGEIEYLGSAKDLISFISWAEEDKWIAKRIRRNIFIKCLIFGSDDAAKLQAEDAKQLRETRILKNTTFFPTSFHLFGNKAIVWQPKVPLAVLIEDEYIAGMLRSMFGALWEVNK